MLNVYVLCVYQYALFLINCLINKLYIGSNIFLFIKTRLDFKSAIFVLTILKKYEIRFI